MKVQELTYLSFESIKNRGSRFWFTVSGMAFAIGVILFLVSLGFGLQNLLLEQITTEDSLLAIDVVSPDPETIRLTDDVLPMIERLRGVTEVVPQITVPSQMDMGEVSSQTTVNGVASGFFSLSGLSPQAGRFFSDEDLYTIVVNEATAELFHAEAADLIGQSIVLSLFVSGSQDGEEMIVIETPFEIVGTVAQAGAPSQVYVPFSVLSNVSPAFSEFQMIKVKVQNESVLKDVREELITMGFLVSALSELIDEANRIFRVIQIVLGIFGFFALIVAAIGLINTMTITLLERTNEIGIMRALGASPRDIKYLFLTESIATGFIGGVLGIILGVAFSEGFNAALNIFAKMLGGEPVSLFIYPLPFLFFVLGLSTLVGFIGGLWPARRAASLNPLQALRYK